jgi:hypothetical protein
VARGFGQSYGATVRREYSEDVQVMATHLTAIQVEEAELLGTVIAREVTSSLVKATIEILRALGIIKGRSTSDDSPPEDFATDEELEEDVMRRANALVGGLSGPRG